MLRTALRSRIFDVLWPALALAACAGDPIDLDAGSTDAAARSDAGPRDDAAAAPDGAARPDGSPGADAGAADERPIVDRPSLGSHTCTLARPATDHSPRQWGSSGHALMTTRGGVAFLGRDESTPAMPFDPAPVSFVLSTLGADGAFGPSIVARPGDGAEVFTPALARRGDGLLMVWVHVDQLEVATFDAAGARTSGPSALGVRDLESFYARPRVAEGRDGGFGLIYSRADTGAGRTLWWQALGADGTKRGAERRVASLSSDLAETAGEIVALEDGFAIAWRDVVGRRGHVWLTVVDAAGVERVAPHRISVTDRDGVYAGSRVGFDQPRIALLPITGGLLAAWSESEEGDIQMGTGASSEVRLVRLDGDGQVTAPPVALRARRVDVDEVQPVLTRLADDAVAVTWASGAHIYICGGCVPDHRLDTVVLDPQTLERRSDVVAVAPGGGRAGGYLGAEVAALGDRLLAVFDVTFHVHATPASALITCAR